MGPPVQGQTEYWEDPTMIGENKEPGHATLIPFDNLDQFIYYEWFYYCREILPNPFS